MRLVAELYKLTARARPAQLAGYLALLGLLLAAQYGGQFQMLLVYWWRRCPATFLLALARPQRDNAAWGMAATLFGITWIALALGHAVLLRELPHGTDLVLDVLIGTFVGDTCAYLGGRAWGQRLLAPRISPNKTVEGLIAGIVGGTIAFWGFEVAYQNYTRGTHALVIGFCVALAAPVGDLFESLIKRDLDVKDTGKVFGPHGGALDRLDAVFFTAVVRLLRVARAAVGRRVDTGPGDRSNTPDVSQVAGRVGSSPVTCEAPPLRYAPVSQPGAPRVQGPDRRRARPPRHACAALGGDREGRHQHRGLLGRQRRGVRRAPPAGGGPALGPEDHGEPGLEIRDERDVLVIDTEDRPGALAGVARRIAGSGREHRVPLRRARPSGVRRRRLREGGAGALASRARARRTSRPGEPRRAGRPPARCGRPSGAAADAARRRHAGEVGERHADASTGVLPSRASALARPSSTRRVQWSGGRTPSVTCFSS